MLTENYRPGLYLKNYVLSDTGSCYETILEISDKMFAV